MNINTLQSHRKEIDEIDNQLLGLLAKRLKIVGEIGAFKKEQELPVVDKKRESEKLQDLAEKGKKHGMRAVFIKKVWALLFKESYIVEQ